MRTNYAAIVNRALRRTKPAFAGYAANVGRVVNPPKRGPDYAAIANRALQEQSLPSQAASNVGRVVYAVPGSGTKLRHEVAPGAPLPRLDAQRTGLGEDGNAINVGRVVNPPRLDEDMASPRKGALSEGSGGACPDCVIGGPPGNAIPRLNRTKCAQSALGPSWANALPARFTRSSLQIHLQAACAGFTIAGHAPTRARAAVTRRTKRRVECYEKQK